MVETPFYKNQHICDDQCKMAECIRMDYYFNHCFRMELIMECIFHLDKFIFSFILELAAQALFLCPMGAWRDELATHFHKRVVF